MELQYFIGREVEKIDKEYYDYVIKKLEVTNKEIKEYISYENYNDKLVLKTFSKKLKFTKKELRERKEAKLRKKKMRKLVNKFKKNNMYILDED